jgi:DNA-binding NarL/FixJ family response regulator
MTLSPREHEVATLIATGETVKNVAARLGVVAKTVEMHLYKAQKKLALRTRRDLIRHMQSA